MFFKKLLTSFTEIAAQHVLTPPPSLREKVPDLSPGVEQVVMTALAKDPKARFATIHAFANALEQAHLAEQALSFAPTILATPKKPAPALQPAPEVAPASPSPTHPVAPEKRGEGLHTSTEAPAISPSPRPAAPPPRRISRRAILAGLAGALVAGGGGITWWILATSPHLSSTSHLLYTYRGHSDIVLGVAWSPDGTRIASGSDDHTVQVWNAADGSNAYTYHGHSDIVNAVAWSHDGTRIASASSDKTVQVWQPG